MAVRRTQPRTVEAVIADDGTTSQAIARELAQSGNFTLPAAVDGAATTKVQVSNDGQTWQDLYDPGAAATVVAGAYTFAASRTLPLHPAVFHYPLFRFVLSAAQSGGPRTIVVRLF